MDSFENRATCNRGQWVCQLMFDSMAHGAYHCPINVKAHQKVYKTFIEWIFPTFEKLLDKFLPLMKTQLTVIMESTIVRDAISSEKRLSILLQFLASGIRIIKIIIALFLLGWVKVTTPDSNNWGSTHAFTQIHSEFKIL